MTVDRALWLRLVESRVERFADTGDASAVLGEEAVEEASALLVAVEDHDDEPDVEARVAIGWLYWCRVVAADGEEARADLCRAIDAFRVVVDLAPEHVPDEIRTVIDPDSAAEAGVAALVGYLDGGDSVDLDTAVSLLRAAASNAGTAERDVVASRDANLATALRERYVLSGNVDDLNDAVTTAERAARATPASSPNRGGVLAVLAAAWQTSFDHSGDVVQIEKAVSCYREALAECELSSENSLLWNNLANALGTLHQIRGDTGDLGASIKICRRLVAEADDDGLADALSTLGLVMRFRHEQRGAAADLDEAAEVGRRAAALALAKGLELSGPMGNLAATLAARYRVHGDAADLDDAITAARSACGTREALAGEVRRSTLGDLLHERWSRTGDEQDWDEAVGLLRAAVENTPAHSAYLVSCLTNLNGALQTRFDQAGTVAAIEEAVVVGRRAVAVTGVHRAGAPRAFSALGLALHGRFEAAGSIADLDEAIRLARQVVGLVGDDHVDRAAYLGNLAAAWWARAQWSVDPNDLDNAVTAGEQAVAAAQQADDRATHNSNLSVALSFRHQLQGAATDLDRAIAAGRSAVFASGAQHPDSGTRWANQSAVLRERFESLGAVEDIDESVDLARRAVQRERCPGPRRAARLAILASALQSRYGALNRPTDLDDAVAAATEAVESTAAASPVLAGRWSNLGAALAARADRDAEPADLRDAVKHMHNAVLTSDRNSPDHAALCANLAMVLVALHAATNEPEAIEEAVSWARRAVSGTPHGQPDRALHLADLGIALGAWHDVNGDRSLLEEALTCFAEAAGQRTAPPVLRMLAARWGGRLAASNGLVEEAASAFTDAVQLIGVTSWHGLDRRSQEIHLATAQGLATDACAALIEVGRLGEAVESLELGRSVLWNRLVDAVTDLPGPAAGDEELSWRLAEVGRLLNHPSRRPGAITSSVRNQAG